MDEQLPGMDLESMPITPSVPEIETSIDPLAELKAPDAIIQPFLPDGVPQQIMPNTQIQGDFNTGPNPGLHKSNTKQGTMDFVDAISQSLEDQSIVEDKIKYGRTYSYGAGYKNQNFERFYNHPKYKQLGFSPYRDNDAYYNERSSWWDDFNRMRGEWTGLAFSGFKSVWGSEEEANEAMERGMAVGSSSRGGFGSSVINFGLNSAYTVGVMSEIMLEDAALLAIEAGTWGTATPEVTAIGAVRNSMAFGRLAKLFSGTYDGIKALRSAETAKQFYNLNKLKKVAEWANPLSRSFGYIKDVTKGTNGYKNLSNLAKVTRGFGEFYRDLREMNVAHSEAKLEGEGASTRYQQKLIDEYFNEHDDMPMGEDARNIYEKGQSIKGTVTLANDLAIYFTNKLTFNELFEGVRPGSKLAKVATDLLEGTGKKFERTAIKDFVAGAKIPLVKLVDQTKKGKVADFLLKSRYVPWSKTYFLGNLGEAFQESTQEVIQSAALDYYDRRDNSGPKLGYYSTLESIGKGIDDQFSGQGLETFLSGYFMGALIQAGGGVFKGGGTRIYEAFTGKASESAEAEKEKERRLGTVVNAVNENWDILSENIINSASHVHAAAEAKKEAGARNDVMQQKNMQEELEMANFRRMASTGTTNLLTDQIDDMLGLDDKSLTEAYQLKEDQAGYVREKLTEYKNRAEGFQRKYELAKEKFPNPANPWMFAARDKKTGELKYPDAYNSQMAEFIAHEEAVNDLLFATEKYERIGERLSNMSQTLAGQKQGPVTRLLNIFRGGTKIGNAAGQDINLLFDQAARRTAIETLQGQIEAFKEGTPEQKKKVTLLQERLDLLRQWNETSHNYYMEYKSDSKMAMTPEERAAKMERMRFRKEAVVYSGKFNNYFRIDEVQGDNVVATNIYTGVKSTLPISELKIETEAPGTATDLEAMEGDQLSWSLAQMYDVYQKYLLNVVKGLDVNPDGKIMQEEAIEAFRMLKDMIALEHDSEKIVKTINLLSDPDYFTRYVEMQKEIKKMADDRKLANLKKAAEKFARAARLNKLLNALFNIKVFVNPEDIRNLNKDITNIKFYDAGTYEEITADDPKYKQILDILEQYETDTGKLVSGKAIPEQGTGEDAAIVSQFNTAGREKNKDDKRTYKQLAEQFGFDPKAESTDVDIAKVLQAIIDSKYTIDIERALARRMLAALKSKAPEDVALAEKLSATLTTIKFVKNLPNPGVFNTGTKEIIIDARYSANDYRGKDGHPIEYVILHEVLHKLTVDALTTDTAFNDEITKLREEMVRYMATPEAKEAFGAKPLYGLMNNAEFVAEAMTNPFFQTLLSKIPREVTGRPSTAWNDFLSALGKMLSRLLGLGTQTTLLDQAVSIITEKIDQTPLTPAGKQGPSAAAAKVTSVSPIEEMKKIPGLVPDLVNAYKKYRNEQSMFPVEGTIDEIADSEAFEEFVKTNVDAINIVNKYKTGAAKKTKTPYAEGNTWMFTGTIDTLEGPEDVADLEVTVLENRGLEKDEDGIEEHVVVLRDNTGRTFSIDLVGPNSATYNVAPVKEKEEVPEEKPEGINVGKDVHPDARRNLNILGFSNKQINELSLEERAKIITQGITAEEYYKDSVEDEAQKDIVESAKAFLSEKPNNAIEMQSWYDLGLFMLGNTEFNNAISKELGTPFTADILDRLRAQKVEDLSKNLKFADLRVNKSVVMQDRYGKGKIKVVASKVKRKSVTLTDPDGSNPITINRDEIRDHILMINGKTIQTAQTSMPLDDEQKEDYKDATENVQFMSDPNASKDQVNKAFETPEEDMKKSAAEKLKQCQIKKGK